MKIEKYKKEYAVKSYEADRNGYLRLISLMNILQDIASENAELLGFGFETCHAKNLAWVGSNYLLQIERLPRIGEHFLIETWPAEGKIWGAIRNFIVKDQQDNALIRVKSQWVLIDIDRRRPVALSKHFPEYHFLNESVMEADFTKMPEITQPDLQKEFSVRYDDIDINDHVNNAVYPLWAAESLSPQFRQNHLPQEIEISFKKEALLGETVKVITKISGAETLHIIYDKNSGDELADCRIKWGKITSKP